MELLVLLVLVFAGFAIGGYLVFINLLINTAKEKGAHDMDGQMSLVGLTLTPIALVLYVIALPDQRNATCSCDSDALPEL